MELQPTIFFGLVCSDEFHIKKKGVEVGVYMRHARVRDVTHLIFDRSSLILGSLSFFFFSIQSGLCDVAIISFCYTIL
jgi:hypothetical protein